MSNIWPYLAGIVDGEGCICLYGAKRADCKYHCTLQVVVYNTSTVLMKWLVKHVGGKYYTRTANGYGNKPGKIQYVWHPSGAKNRENFLLGILPYLVIKKEQAKVALEFLRLGSEKCPELRKPLVEKCIRLNRGEEPVETNTLNDSQESKIESGLTGDGESAPVVTQIA
jgi:hypothetical protein